VDHRPPWHIWAGPAFLAQRVNRRGRDDPFDAVRQFSVQGYERVCLQQGERNVLGVVGRGPSQLIRDFPGPTPEHRVAEEPDLHPPDAGEMFARDFGWDLPALDGLVEGRQRLGTKERRCQEFVLAWDLDLRAHQVKDGAGVYDKPGHRVPRIGLGTLIPTPPASACGIVLYQGVWCRPRIKSLPRAEAPEARIDNRAGLLKSDFCEYGVERRRYPVEIRRAREQTGVAKLAAGAAAQEPPHLGFDVPAPPAGLHLQGAERAEVAL
jgi:hypothetical protein